MPMFPYNFLKSKTVLLFFIPFLFLLGCKGPKGDPGLTGPTGPAGPVATKEREGFIKADLKTKVDGKDAPYKIDFEGKNVGYENYFEKVNDSVTNISVGKVYADNGDAYLNGKCLLSFTMKTLKDSVNIKGTTLLELNFSRLKDGQLNDVMVNCKFTQSQDVIKFKEVKYDSVSRIIKGNFSAKFFQKDSIGNNIYEDSISNGFFSSVIYQRFRNYK